MARALAKGTADWHRSSQVEKGSLVDLEGGRKPGRLEKGSDDDEGSDML